MEKENQHLPIGPELDATLERLSRMFEVSREELTRVLLEEAAYSVEDTYDRSGQIWDSIRFDYVHGGRRALKRAAREDMIEEFLNGLSDNPEESDQL